MKHMKRCSASVLDNCESEVQCGISTHRSEWSASKKSRRTNAGEGMEEKELPSLLMGMKVSKFKKESRTKVH